MILNSEKASRTTNFTKFPKKIKLLSKYIDKDYFDIRLVKVSPERKIKEMNQIRILPIEVGPYN